jgi:hypothetical protein
MLQAETMESISPEPTSFAILQPVFPLSAIYCHPETYAAAGPLPGRDRLAAALRLAPPTDATVLAPASTTDCRASPTSKPRKQLSGRAYRPYEPFWQDDDAPTSLSQAQAALKEARSTARQLAALLRQSEFSLDARRRRLGLVSAH